MGLVGLVVDFTCRPGPKVGHLVYWLSHSDIHFSLKTPQNVCMCLPVCLNKYLNIELVLILFECR